jgi:hypothetical protein
MQVRYSKPFAWFMLILGGINLALAAVLYSMRAPAFGPLIPGVVCVGIALLYLNRPFFHYDERSIVIKALIGPLKREFPYGPDDHFEADGPRVYLVGPQGRKKVPVSRWLADKRDFDAFLRFIKL